MAIARREMGRRVRDDARLLHAAVHRIPMAIPAPHPGSEGLRPTTRTPVRGLYLAGDWMATGLPCSMESAVRAGWCAAEAVLADRGAPAAIASPLPGATGLARLLRRRAAPGTTARLPAGGRP